MSTTITVNRQCGRCPRIEREEVSIEAAARLAQSGLKEPPALKVVVDGEEVLEFDRLCLPCRQIVAHHLHAMSKKLAQHSSVRKAAGKAKAEKSKA